MGAVCILNIKPTVQDKSYNHMLDKYMIVVLVQACALVTGASR